MPTVSTRKSAEVKSSEGAPSDCFSGYLRDIARLGKLTNEENAALAGRIASGDRNALHELVTGNLGLVIPFARKYARGDLSIEDLVQEGNRGLMDAARKFNPVRGTFKECAAPWIMKYIHLAQQDRGPVRISRSDRELIRDWNGAKQSLGTDATVGEIVEQMKSERIAKLERRLGAVQKQISQGKPAEHSESRSELKRARLQLVEQRLITKLAVSGSGFALGDERLANLRLALFATEASNRRITSSTPYPGDRDPVALVADVRYAREKIERAGAIDDIAWRIERLSEKEQDILKRKYLSGDGEERALIDVASDLGLAVNTVRKYHEIAIRKLAASSKA